MRSFTLKEMTHQVRDNNIALGWRAERKSFGDYIALLHSEASEALDAYRDHRLADATANITVEGKLTKPQGVGSELADVLIRLIDMCDFYEIDLEAEYDRKMAYNRTRAYQHGGRTISDESAVTDGYLPEGHNRTPECSEEVVCGNSEHT